MMIVPAGEQHLLFTVGPRTFAVPGSHVVRVMRHRDAGDVLLADMGLMVGDPPTVIGEQTCVVVVSVGRAGSAREVGLVVDAAIDVLTVGRSDIVAKPDFGPRVDLTYLAGLLRCGETFAISLDIDRLLADLEAAEVAR